MDNLESFHKIVVSTRYKSESFWEFADDLKKENLEYEKRLVTAFLVANGSGLVLCFGAFVSNSLPRQDLLILVPSLWLFLVGLVSVASGLVFYLRNLSHLETYYRTKGNIQSVIQSIRMNLERQKIDIEKFSVSEFSKNFKLDFDEVTPQLSLTKSASLTAARIMIYARVAFFCGFLCFIFGILIPIISISMTTKFIF